MMTLDEEITWWTQHVKRTDEVGFLALGMATGLKWAKKYYKAQQVGEEDESTHLR